MRRPLAFPALFFALLGQLLAQPEAEEELGEGTHTFSLLRAEPVCTPLECGARLCLSSLSPGSELLSFAHTL